MKIKTLIPVGALLATFVLVHANAPAPESAPPGSLEKITAALPKEDWVKPAKSRKLLVFSATAGFRHESIATGKLALTEMGKRMVPLRPLSPMTSPISNLARLINSMPFVFSALHKMCSFPIRWR